MRLREICRLAAERLEQDESHVEIVDGVLVDLSVVDGPIPVEHMHDHLYFPKAGTPQKLDGEMEFSADWMLMDACRHLPDITLTFYDSEEALVRAILGGRGVFNPFTDWAIAFVRGRVRRFRCSYVSPDGVRRVFDKRKQRGEDVFERDYPEPRLRWLDDES